MNAATRFLLLPMIAVVCSSTAFSTDPPSAPSRPGDLNGYWMDNGRPVADNDTEEGCALNRCIELSVRK